MPFIGGKFSSVHTLHGKWQAYDYNIEDWVELKVDFMYSERDGFAQSEDVPLDDLLVKSDNLTMETYSPLGFKTKDYVYDKQGIKYQISNVVIEPEENPFRNKFNNNRGFQKKVIFME